MKSYNTYLNLFAVSVAVIVSGCSKDSSTTPEPPAPPVVTVTFTKPTVSVVSDSSATFNTNLTVAGIPNITER